MLTLSPGADRLLTSADAIEPLLEEIHKYGNPGTERELCRLLARVGSANDLELMRYADELRQFLRLQADLLAAETADDSAPVTFAAHVSAALDTVCDRYDDRRAA